MSGYILTPQEINYLERMIISKRIDYIRKLQKYNNKCVDIESVHLQNEKSVEEIVFEIFDAVLNASNMENTLSSEFVCEAIKVLTEKERLVLFSFYCEGKTTVQIAKELNISQSRVSHIKTEAKDKVYQKYQELKGKK